MVYMEIITRHYRNRNTQVIRFALQIKFRASIIANPTRIETIVDELELAAKQAKWHFFLDLVGVRFMSAYLLQQLVPICQECQNRHLVSVPICNVHTELREIIRLSRLTKITTVVPTVTDALKVLATTKQPELLRAVG